MMNQNMDDPQLNQETNSLDNQEALIPLNPENNTPIIKPKSKFRSILGKFSLKYLLVLLLASIIGIIVNLPHSDQQVVTKADAPVLSTQLVIQFSKDPKTGAISVDQITGVKGAPPKSINDNSGATATLTQEFAGNTVTSAPLTFAEFMYTDNFATSSSKPYDPRIKFDKPLAWAVVPYAQGSLYKVQSLTSSQTSGRNSNSVSHTQTKSQTLVIDPTTISKAVQNLYVSKASVQIVNPIINPTVNQVNSKNPLLINPDPVKNVERDTTQ